MTHIDKNTAPGSIPEGLDQGHVNNDSDDIVKNQNHPRIWIILGGIVVLMLSIILMILFRENSGEAAANGKGELNFAEVVIADLVQENEFSGTVGSLDADPITAQQEGTITELPPAGKDIHQGEVLYTINEDPVILLHGELPAFQDLTIGEDTMPVVSQLNGVITWVPAPGTIIEQGEVLFRGDDRPVILLYGEQPAFRAMYDYDPHYHNNQISYGTYITKPPTYDEGPNLIGNDVLQLEQALVDLGFNHRAMRVDNEFDYATRSMVKKFQSSVGADYDGVIQLGEVVFLPGPAQVLEVFASPGNFSGGTVLGVSTGDPSSGTLVLQLEGALSDLGFNTGNTLEVDGIFTPETTQAVLDFQAASGLDQDGLLNLGEVVFLPGDLRITSLLATQGSSVGPGSPVLGISLTDKVVKTYLPADKQDLLEVGDAVTIEMPDFTEVTGSVVFVSNTALATGNDWDPPVFEVQIEFDDPSVAAGLDEAPVDVIVVSDSVDDVMAVPVSALLALLEGGYAVEVQTTGSRIELVAVEIGFFGSNNMIEIRSGEISPGDLVVVP